MSAVSDDGQTELVRDYYNEAARRYDSWMEGFDRLMLGRGRSRMCSRARGPTLEVAVGTGANLPYYPPDAEITGVDLSRAMLAFAERRAQQLHLDIDLQVGVQKPDQVLAGATGRVNYGQAPHW
jgi:ubiquinone/menaquinone biosynthesis C-methylase UbiE